MDAPYEFYEQLEALEKILSDPAVTLCSAWSLILKKWVIKESLRAHAYLSLYNVATDMVVANRIIPDSVSDPFFLRWKEQQTKYKEEIHQNFHPLPVKEIPLYSEEMCGIEALERLKGDAIRRRRSRSGVLQRDDAASGSRRRTTTA